MDIKADISRSGVTQSQIDGYSRKTNDAMDRLWSGEEDFTGWVDLPVQHNEEALEEVLMTAAEIQAKCDCFIVAGIGGSYMGARAVIEALGGNRPGYPEVIFAGNNLSGTYHKRIIEKIRNRETCMCIISKSGKTIEPLAAFSLIKESMRQKYGEKGAAKRIYAITDEEKGVLRKEVRREGYQSFIVPADIGGRYSVLSAVGLLPAAVAGIDVKRLIKGAEVMAKDPAWDTDAADYAAARNVLRERGRIIEVFEFFEPSMEYFGEWLKQLFGESEGKEGKGIYPETLSFTRDLHSMGQFLQEGNPVLFETVFRVDSPSEDIMIPASAGAPLAGKTFGQINRCITEGVISAHEKAGIPVITVDIPEMNAFVLGQLIYFFELSCAVSAMIMGVDPFDQPGVEKYKKEAEAEINRL